MTYERDGRAAYAGPACYCGSRATRRVDDFRECQACGGKFFVRVTGDGVRAMTLSQAVTHDMARRHGMTAEQYNDAMQEMNRCLTR